MHYYYHPSLFSTYDENVIAVICLFLAISISIYRNQFEFKFWIEMKKKIEAEDSFAFLTEKNQISSELFVWF